MVDAQWAIGVALLLLLAAGVIPCWPARPDRGIVAAATWVFLSVCVSNGLVDDIGIAVSVAGVCTMLAFTLAAQDYFADLAGYAQRPLIMVAVWAAFSAAMHDRRPNVPAFILALVVLCAPVMVLLLADARGHRFALAPMALAGGVVFVAAVDPTSQQWLLPGWTMAMFAVLLAQSAATRAAASRLFAAVSDA